jgi:hypothetical protein
VNFLASPRRPALAAFALFAAAFVARDARAQIDPEPRQLIQLGYNLNIEGRGPIAGYAYYYHNHPGFLHTNVTLRLAIAPVYLDSELGIAHALGPDTHLGIGIAGGGYADSYSEVRGGNFVREESFTGHGANFSSSVYHRFNPSQQIPLNAVLRGGLHYTTYDNDSKTAPTFVLPRDQTSFSIRAGLRYGGVEPVLQPELAMELSTWYEGRFFNEGGFYGFSGDRRVNPDTHLFWSRALLAYTLPSHQRFYVSLTGGASVRADRLNAYRLGAVLPMASEFPLSIPGYYFQEITATRFALLSGNYLVPFGAKKEWSLTTFAATAAVDYLDGMQQPGAWNSGVGAAFGYRPANRVWQISLGYAYGIDAIRKGDRGAQSVGVLMQYDLEKRKQESLAHPEEGIGGNRWNTLKRIFGF